MRFVPWTRRAAWSVGTVPYMNGHAQRLVRCIAPLSAGEVVPAVLLAVWVAAPLTCAAMVIHEALDPQFSFGGANAFFWLVLGSGWPIGHAFQRRAIEADALARRARQLAVERDEAAHTAVESERARIAR